MGTGVAIPAELEDEFLARLRYVSESAEAFELWRASLQPLLGRFAFVLLGERQGRTESSDSADGSGLAVATAAPLGFLAGRVRSQPPYFGGEPAGFLSELFVEEAQRGRGVAAALLDASVEWFAGRGVVRVELQVPVGNADARARSTAVAAGRKSLCRWSGRGARVSPYKKAAQKAERHASFWEAACLS